MSRGPRRIYHRGRRRYIGLFDWIRIIGMGAGLLVFVGYLLWIYVFKPVPHMLVWLPVVMR